MIILDKLFSIKEGWNCILPLFFRYCFSFDINTSNPKLKFIFIFETFMHIALKVK